MTKIDGIVLCGGCSTRAKANKMISLIEGEPMIVHTVKSILPFVNNLYVVTGHYHDDTVNSLNSFSNITIVHNESYMKGMFSSVLKGVKRVKNDFFILPGDCPFVKPSTFELLLSSTGDIRCPSYKNKDGHPLYISYSLVNELLSMSSESNLKEFRNKHGFTKVEVNDPNILNDIDTHEDYINLLKKERK